MSYESAITGLKKLMRHELFDLDPKEHRARVYGESDRASIILQAAVLERFVIFELTERMPNINSDERAAIFNFEGPCGSFSNRIKLAQALGIIDRKLRRQLDLVREMRNVAAHAHPEINFETPEIKEAVYALCDPKHRDLLAVMPRSVLRRTFDYLCGALMKAISGKLDAEELSREMAALRDWAIEHGHLPSPDKLPKRKSPKHSKRVEKARHPNARRNQLKRDPPS